MHLEQVLPKISSEGGILIRHNKSRHAMQFENLIHEGLRHQSLSKQVR